MEKKQSVLNLVRLAFLLSSLLSFTGSSFAQQPSFNGEKTSWREGFYRYDFIMDEQTLAITPFKAPEGEHFGVQDPPAGKRRCILIAPKQPAPGNPWSWRGCYWDHQPQTEVELLRRGFYVAYISANANLKPGKEWDAWYDFLTAHGLSSKPAFIGMSRGGEYEYTWATNHPDKVSCIYADNPAITPEAISKLGELAKNNVPLLHVCGSFDPLLQIATIPVENIYRSLGGRISVMIKEGFGHHPHSLLNPSPIADFIEQSVREARPAKPDFVAGAVNRTFYYSDAEDYHYAADENTYITYRGPLFAPVYERFIFQLPGVESFVTVIAPNKAAAGNPWVFRCGYVKRDAVVDQGLLAKGFYIVAGAVPYNADGPQLAQWNAIYKYFTDHGFSRKPAIEGDRSAAGEAIAWGIENPDKVSCIYAENPILKSRVMTKTLPIDNLAPLAKAAIPILFVAGDADPFYKDQSLLAAKRYQALGGKITLVTRKGEGYALSGSIGEPGLKFVVEHTKW
ncbi:MAG TPA: hypothetical protein VG890_01570 [Puia sp.]|nr:hypothetical protein [Puia sp.]